MTEWLALPPPLAPATGLDAWVAAFAAGGHPAVVAREDGATWIEVATQRLRGFVAFEGDAVEAINFEMCDTEAFALLQSVASSLGWELHPEDGEEDD